MTEVTKFSEAERAALLAVKGVGPKVIERMEEMGIASLGALATQSAEDICARAAAIVGSTCWKNSPQARSAIGSAIDYARSHAGCDD